MLTTTAVALVTLSQSISNAGFINKLSNHVSVILETQRDKDGKMKHNKYFV